jgi:predicted RNA-binding Zn ribbon-like protein
VTSADLPRPDAPAAAAVVRDFVNTTDRETGVDEIETAADLARYLVREGLAAAGARATSADLALARRLRHGLRRAMELNHDAEARPAESLPELAAALQELPVRLDWTEAGAVARPSRAGVRGALAQIGLAAQDAAAEGVWWRLKVCAWDECEWAYYDRSKNRSRSWCEYGCGNKVKTRAYRARRRSASLSTPRSS